MPALVGQRIFAIALGYEDINDHDHLRHDPVLQALADKLTSKRSSCAALAGKSTLNRLEHAAKVGSGPYHKISYDKAAIAGLLVTLCLESYAARMIIDLDATHDPIHGEQKGRHFHGYYDCYCYLPLYIFCGRHLLAAKHRRTCLRSDGLNEIPHLSSKPGQVHLSRSKRSRNLYGGLR